MTHTGSDTDAATKPIYQFDEKLRDHVTRVTQVRRFETLSDTEKPLFKNPPENAYIIETADTIFYAQGGGQPFDTGYMSIQDSQQKEQRFQVEAVRSGSNGRILHLVPGAGVNALQPGDMVEQHVNGERRDLNSRAHTAGHIIALSVRHLAKTTPELVVSDSKASHFPDACYVEFKGLIDGKHKDAIQQQATQYVQDALPIKLFWVRPEELGETNVITAEGMPVVAGQDGRVRIVDIVGAGAYPCGGTHVPDTSVVGEVLVKGIKRQKGISKVSYTVSIAG